MFASKTKAISLNYKIRMKLGHFICVKIQFKLLRRRSKPIYLKV